MNKWILLFLIMLIQGSPDNHQDLFNSRYQKALSYYEAAEPSEFTDSISMALFKEILLSKNSKYLKAEVLLDIYEKCGNLALIKGDFNEAIGFYRSGLSLKNHSDIPDSLLFATTLFLGETYYLLSRPDSSIFFLKEAERLLRLKTSSTESSRLFNSLGVIYFESGNYNQSITYFDKAKNLIIGDKKFSELQPFYQYALFSFLNNIGSSLLQLNKLDDALSIYKELEKSGLNEDQVNSQIAGIFLKKSEPDSAFLYLNKIKSEKFRQSSSFQNQLAEIYLMQDSLEQAKNILIHFLSASGEVDKSIRDFRKGKSYGLLAKVAFAQHDYQKALEFSQKAIIQIDGYFSDEDVFVNPQEFSLGFATFSLIESLVDKAKTFVRLHEIQQDKRNLEAAISTFQTAFDMAFYISNHYDNDEARIFLGDFVLKTYEDGVEFLISQFRLTSDLEYLKKALEWSERSKSTSLNIALREKKIKKNSHIDEIKLNQERDLQFAISKIQQLILTEKDNIKIAELQKSLTDKRLELSRFQAELNQDSNFVKEKWRTEFLDINYIQNELLDNRTAILSFFEGNNNLILFLITHDKLKHTIVPKSEELIKALQSLKKQLVQFNPGQKYKTGEEGFSIFKGIFSDEIYVDLKNYPSLLVIPHGIFVDFPLEILEVKPGKFFLNYHSITYQYSIQLLKSYDNFKVNSENSYGFAPFFEHFWSDKYVQLDELTFSVDEINNIKGRKFIGKSSDKKTFLSVLPKAEFIQLSTHGIPDPENPDLAFISLFPGGVDDRLYSNEVANLDMSHTVLVFLSACETNFGATSRSEGVLSISRAFMLAGSQNIISSLWKAEDKSTAYITATFYENLNKGRSFDVALQKAKLKLLSDPKMAHYQHPFFWSHLVLVGNIKKQNTKNPFYLYLGSVLLFLLIIGFLRFFWKFLT